MDTEEQINKLLDRSLRSVFPMQVAENATSRLNYQTSIFNEPID